MSKFEINEKKTASKVGGEIRKLWAMVQMFAMVSGAIAILYCAVKHANDKNLQYALASIATVLLFSVVWKIYLLLGDN